jgi:hypothetical protein
MVPLDYVLAVAAVTAPGDIAGEYAHLGTALRQVALCWELIDPRERRCLRGQGGSFADDLKWLRRRHDELENAPRTGEAFRLPPLRVVKEGLQFNLAFRKTLASRAEGATGPTLEEAQGHLKELDRRHRIWGLMQDAHRACYCVTARRRALRDLREAVGDEAFFRGEWPAVVPVEAFRER